MFSWEGISPTLKPKKGEKSDATICSYLKFRPLDKCFPFQTVMCGGVYIH